MEASGDKPKKAHKKRHAGLKAKKKKEKQTGKVDRHNPRAFTFSGGTKSVQKRVQYTLEKQAKKDRAPKIDKNPQVPPPFIVVVQGPPGVGKSTLITSLVKHYARQRLLQMGGPITLVSGRQRRITLVECPQDMSAMLDLAKVADLVLLLIDASFGFELETFEFINILQVHGFPRVLGVLTHLDGFKDNKALRKVKKTMKHRFWTEIYNGAKLFHLSGLQHGRYHRLEVQNLARFIAVQKVPLLSWRQAHPYVLALRWEDKTDPTKAPHTPRTLDLYGYVCGGRLREGTQAHLAGVGDFHIAALKTLPDPCPPPEVVEADRTGAKPGERPKKKNALRTLAERHRLVYAPGSDVGSITVDSEAMYINLPEVQVGFTKREGEAEGEELPEAVKLVRAMQGGKASLDAAAASRPGLRLLGDSTVRLPEGGPEDLAKQGEEEGQPRQRRRAPAGNDSVPAERDAAAEGGEEGDDEGEEEEGDDEAGGSDDEASGKGSGAEGGEGEDSDAEEQRKAFMERARARFARAAKLEDVIYGTGKQQSTKGGGDKDGAVVQQPAKATDHATVPLFDDEEEDGGAEEREEEDEPRPDLSGLLGNLGDLDGMDTARMLALPGEADALDEEAKEALKERKFITGGWSSEDEEKKEKDDGGGEEAAEGEAPKKVEGQEAAGKGAEAAAAAKAAADLEGFTDGVAIAHFVRIRLEDVPAACVAEFKRERPIVLGGLLPGESRMGMVQARVKRHRWHPKLLKTGDAMLVSVGWRRFQTVPTFSLEDRGEKRMRYLKYTLEHAHCTMTMHAPMMPPNTGVLCFRSWEKVGHFRVCATGGVLESAPNFQIMKKLKLVGEPYKIFRNTSFVKNMFNTDLEVSKYMHAKVQTVSGIRGEIKKAEGTRGSFRATFEDRILMSDLVVCKCWINVEPKQFYHPVIDVAQWRPARLIGELRAAAGVPVPDNKDSQYGGQFVRPERRFNPIRIPKTLQEALPFQFMSKGRERKKDALRKKAAVVSSDRDRAINGLLTRLHTIRREKERIRTQASAKKKAAKEKREQFIQDKRDVHTKEAKKKRYQEQGKKLAKRQKALRLT